MRVRIEGATADEARTAARADSAGSPGRSWSVAKVGLIVAAAVAFMLLVVMRAASKLGLRGPCPSSLAMLVDNPVRRRQVRAVLPRVGIQAGERVLELGPGPGAFTLAAARAAGPEGKLIAVDIQPEMIAAVERKVAQAGAGNVETHVASAYELPVASDSIDRAFLVTVLPEVPDQARALSELHRVLKPGGVLSISEQFMDPDYPLLSTTVRNVTSAGFEEVERHGNWWFYTVNFRKT